MRTSISNALKRKFILLALLSISTLSLIIKAESSDNFKNIIFGKIDEKSGFLKQTAENTAENPFKKFISFKKHFEDMISNLMFSNSKGLVVTDKNIRTSDKPKENNNVLAFTATENNTLNITEHTINSLLFMVQRAVPINLSIKNDTSNPLPIAVDTASLSLIIPELSSKYNKNMNMTLTVYEDTLNCATPSINMAIDGIYIDFDIGLKMGVFNEETQQYDEILDTIISAGIKATIYTQDNKLNVFLMKVVVDDLKIKNNTLELEKDTLITKFTGFLSLIIDQTRKMLTQVDVLKTLNDFSGLNFSSFEVMSNVGSMVVTIQ